VDIFDSVSLRDAAGTMGFEYENGRHESGMRQTQQAVADARQSGHEPGTLDA
jgi:hypothetical protein